MTRLTLLGFAGTLLAVSPASAQTAPDSTAAPADAVSVGDSVAVPVYDTAQAAELNTEARRVEQTSDFAAALALYDRALVADPTYAPALLGRGNMLSQLGRNADARTAYEAAIAASTDKPEYAVVLPVATRNAAIVADLLVQEAEVARQNAAVAAQTEAVAEQTAAIEAATALLTADPVTPEAAQQAYDHLERARTAGYDANAVAFYYAKALNSLGRGAEALPYAEQALAAAIAADATADVSAFYIQLGIANRFAANDPAARAAFESAKAGSWAGWADHYLAEMGPAPTTTP
jgi:tetratricopeptide (TPR) repeat protein